MQLGGCFVLMCIGKESFQVGRKVKCKYLICMKSIELLPQVKAKLAKPTVKVFELFHFQEYSFHD